MITHPKKKRYVKFHILGIRLFIIRLLMFPLLGHRPPLYEREWAIIHHAGPVRIGRCHMSSNFLVLGHAGFLTMLFFTVLRAAAFWQHYILILTNIINAKESLFVTFSGLNHWTNHPEILHIRCQVYRNGHRVPFIPKKSTVTVPEQNNNNVLVIIDGATCLPNHDWIILL